VTQGVGPEFKPQHCNKKRSNVCYNVEEPQKLYIKRKSQTQKGTCLACTRAERQKAFGRVRRWWLMPVILNTQEAEIQRIVH
jgi:hypothetical protein